MNVEIGAEAALFLEKEYINGIAVAVCINNKFTLNVKIGALLLMMHKIRLSVKLGKMY